MLIDRRFEIVDHPHEDEIDGDVDAIDVGGLQAAHVQAVIDEANCDEQRDDDEERLVHVQANLHDAVVNVGLVCLEHAFSSQLPLDGDANHVDAGDEEEREGGEEGFFTIGESAYSVGHLIFDGEVGDDIAETKAA